MDDARQTRGKRTSLCRRIGIHSLIKSTNDFRERSSVAGGKNQVSGAGKVRQLSPVTQVSGLAHIDHRWSLSEAIAQKLIETRHIAAFLSWRVVQPEIPRYQGVFIIK